MKRTLAATALSIVLIAETVQAADLYVSPGGNDANPGTQAQPLKTLAATRQAVRKLKATAREPITVMLGGGTYYLPETLVFTPEDSGSANAPITYAAAPGQQPILSGGVKLDLQWTPYKDGILQARVPAGCSVDQLFLNGQRQQRARYPNFDPNSRQPYNGVSDGLPKQRTLPWANPQGGFMHAIHHWGWGDCHRLITGRDSQGNVVLTDGWGNNRATNGGNALYVENIFEELDAPGEWFLDAQKQTLYFMPPEGADLSKAKLEGVRLAHVIELRGSQESPVKFLAFKGLTITHAAQTFTETKEPLLRSDWCIYRGGAVFCTGAEDCRFENLFFDAVGGNALFVSNYARRITVTGCKITEAGASGVCFVGDPASLHAPLYWQDCGKPFDHIDHTPGPKTQNFPALCTVHDNLIYRIGRFEKQTAGVQISMASEITVSHNSIYDVPRAGINIGEGAFGGHVIEFNDVFDTVKETSDHGSFNSWGRDRFWGIAGGYDAIEKALAEHPDLPRWDTVKTIVIRNNRMRCDRGNDIDLDDGSSNYHIYNNLCLRGGIKNREGFYRVVENNIMVGTFHPHVWFKNSGDVFVRNIVFQPYIPAGDFARPAGKQIDYNLLHDPKRSGPATELRALMGRDEHSLVGDAMFVDPAAGDYRVKEGSPALRLGFRNFPMDRFGVLSPKLRAEARIPELPPVNK